MIKLGVNIDHVATLRQARREFSPDPIEAARICEAAGCHSIVAHLREDRRHIQDKDIFTLKKTIKTILNLEMSIQPEIVNIALKLKPHQATLVPERRQEITTEGGLDVSKYFNRIKHIIKALQNKNIDVSLFIAADKKQIDKSYEAGCRIIEIHTGSYANAISKTARQNELKKISEMTHYAQSLGITVNAGHGLNYENVRAIAKIPGMNELNIGHSIISRAVFVGLKNAVIQMKKAIEGKGK